MKGGSNWYHFYFASGMARPGTECPINQNVPDFCKCTTVCHRVGNAITLQSKGPGFRMWTAHHIRSPVAITIWVKYNASHLKRQKMMGRFGASFL